MISSDEILIARVRAGDRKALEEIYTNFRLEFFDWALKKHGCSLELAKDVYQQTILTVYENISHGKLNRLTSKLKTYVFAVGRNLLFDLRRSEILQKTKEAKAFENGLYSDQASDKYTEECFETIEKSMMEMSPKCRALLLGYYYERKSMKELSKMLGFSNEQSAKTQKYKCLQKLKLVYENNIRTLNQNINDTNRDD
jgi:RNA polymerase sigma-70 factor (ECF subfamily)